MAEFDLLMRKYDYQNFLIVLKYPPSESGDSPYSGLVGSSDVVDAIEMLEIAKITVDTLRKQFMQTLTGPVATA